MADDFPDDEIADMMPTARDWQATPICIKHRNRLPCWECVEDERERRDDLRPE